MQVNDGLMHVIKHKLVFSAFLGEFILYSLENHGGEERVFIIGCHLTLVSIRTHDIAVVKKHSLLRGSWYYHRRQPLILGKPVLCCIPEVFFSN